jgi:hypothetical protein
MSEINQNQNNYNNSVILKLESLTNEYNHVLLQYQKAIANYTNFLQQDSQNQYSITNGKAFWGTGVAGAQSPYPKIPSPDSCQALCSKTKGCTGATYNPSNNGSCFLRSGEGSVVPSSETDTAIVPLSKEYLNNIKNLNQQLTTINEKIMGITASEGKNVYNTEEINRKNKNIELKQNYETLLNERKVISEKLKNLQSLEETQNDTGIVTNSNYLSYVLLLTFAVVIIVILVKISGSDSGSGNTNTVQQYGGGLSKKVYFLIIAIFVFSFIVYYNKN